METFTGLMVDPLHIHPDEIRIEDIAHALALQCRYNGHCKHFYSIAQHSVLVSDFSDFSLGLFGLLHDAAEAYLGDMITPLKNVMLQYKPCEKAIQRSVFGKFCGRLPNDTERQQLVDVDTGVLLAEAHHLMPSKGIGWRDNVKPIRIDPIFWSPEMAERNFLRTFGEFCHVRR